MTNPLDYKPSPIPEDCHFRIGASSFYSFVQTPWNWYREAVLKETLFDYNTSSVLGTCVHYCAEQYAKKEPIDKQMINAYIDKHPVKVDYDPYDVKEALPSMAEAVVNGYVKNTRPIGVEMCVAQEIGKGYAVSTSIDLLEGTKEDTLITDYKTYNSKTKPKSISPKYKTQLLVTDYILRKHGYNPTRIRTVNVNRPCGGGLSEKTGKPLKVYPAEVTKLTEEITPEDREYIDNCLNLCVESMEAAKKYPHLTHCIFHDMRLKLEEHNNE
ncbi:PD-(D/E)XK nuclease family protein [Candidatus Macondimonas diazotrophica]|jgi:hypothetical protein|uniref:PD-(D/E)XK endonuclease-like domain-containing protein n=1 Tax=Candidatus Macondimonas diazotrophica TaxID=2305248 RepID=A0A4Z0F850_9GAMM|nr:PD-(D/E)XK nuclease family protein [Candidatus Macondimonas diazotrophica]TFZ81433.1 hypothetical protein E4680_12520 [Candidatus Macondimonas diazotrophica]